MIFDKSGSTHRDSTRRHPEESQLTITSLIQQLQSAASRQQDTEQQLRLRDADLDRLQHENKRLASLLAQRQSELTGITRSFSWKMTAILRRLKILSPRYRIQLALDAKLIESSGLFSRAWYLAQYDDVCASGIDPTVHYLIHGWKEGRIPHPLFDPSWYLEHYPDVATCAVNPLVHFLRSGIPEGRLPHGRFEELKWPEAHCAAIHRYFLRKTAGTANLCWYDAENPQLSIVILNLNKAHLTLQCLASLWQHTRECKYEIIVVDNGSQPEDVSILKSIEGPFKLICLDRNRFFGEGNNLGAEAARGEFLAFLNNDVVVTEGWLVPLLQAFREHPDCGAAGPKFLFPDGRLLEAGAFVREDGRAIQHGKWGDPNNPEFNRAMKVNYVSAATVLLRKESFERAQGFDFRWEPAYYEDVDLCFKLASLNLHTYYVPESTVVHYESATTTDPRQGLRLHDIAEINRRRFLDRWRPYLLDRSLQTAQRCVHLPPRQPAPAGEPGKSRVALFTPHSIIPGGGERYLLTIAESLLDEYEVWLVTPEKYSRIRIDSIARTLDLDLGRLHLASLKDLDESAAIDVWLTMGNQIVPPIASRGRHNLFVLQFPFYMAAGEIGSDRCFWNGYERIVVYSAYLASRVTASTEENGFPPRPIDIIPPPVDVDAVQGVPHKNEYSIISVGRFSSGWHCKRQDLLITAFRRIVEDYPDLPLELHLVGSLHPEPENREYFRLCQQLASGLPVHFHLDASGDKLASLYRSSSIYWYATGLGIDQAAHPEKVEHFGISLVEGMANGCIPIVFGSGSHTEIVKDGVTGLHFRDVDGLVAATTHVLEEGREGWVSQMRLAALDRSTSFNKAVFREAWRKVVRGALAQSADTTVVSE